MVKRTFDASGVRLESLFVGDAKGERILVNVDSDWMKEASQVDLGWVVPALQSATREGWRVELLVKWCGAAGRIGFTDGVRNVP